VTETGRYSACPQGADLVAVPLSGIDDLQKVAWGMGGHGHLRCTSSRHAGLLAKFTSM
jgi:hypothetical protein